MRGAQGASTSAVAEVDYRGFRLIHLHAAAPVEIAPAPADNGPPTSPTALVLAP